MIFFKTLIEKSWNIVEYFAKVIFFYIFLFRFSRSVGAHICVCVYVLLILFTHFRMNFKMTRLFEKISDTCDQKELWKVTVKVHHKWTVITNNKEHLELIFVDANVSLGFQLAIGFVIVVIF